MKFTHFCDTRKLKEYTCSRISTQDTLKFVHQVGIGWRNGSLNVTQEDNNGSGYPWSKDEDYHLLY